LATHVADSWGLGELTITGMGSDERLIYSEALSNERNERWPSDTGQWQVYESAPIAAPPTTDEVEFDVTAVWTDHPSADMMETIQVHITNDAPILYDQWSQDALATAVLNDTPTSNVDVNVGGGTENAVVHSCSTTGAGGGSAAILGLLALVTRRRRRA
jgi:MYXO-CTERM domain-containing protein